MISALPVLDPESPENAINLFITESGNNRVRRVDGTSGVITTVAGDGSPHWPPQPIM